MDDIFNKWTALSDEYQKQFALLQTGDKSACKEARRLAKELDLLTREMRAAESRNGDRMKAGIYQIQFTMDTRSLGSGAVVVKGRSFVGADGIHFYRGDIRREGTEVAVLMEVTRHNFAVGSPFGNEALFTLRWRGAIAADFSFQLEHQLANSRSTVRVSGRIVDAAD
ncbi:hypothetical protein LJR175_007776 [Variovorax sp. LjRoot175]|uniref:hypothetical protein n=1 Tax=Variovorax sp. LjRoot175 TaxID=3342276 RepID=UPI003ECFE1E3